MWPALIVALSLGASRDEIEADYLKQPVEQRANIFYLDLPKNSKNDWAAALALIVPSTSRALVLNRQLPQQVTPTVYRINLGDLLWKVEDFEKVLEKYPYHRPKGGRRIRGDWLLSELSDSAESTAYYDLLFSGLGTPKTIKEFYDRLGVDQAKALQQGLDFGLVETKSGVARHLRRYIQFVPALTTYDSTTYDTDSLSGKDPLEFALLKDFPFAASEHIFGVPKVWYSQRDGRRVGGRGAMSVFALSNNKGELQKAAPTNIVVDHTQTRQDPQIRYPVSCLSCHRNAFNAPSSNGLKNLFNKGVELYAKTSGDQEAIERFHLTDEADEIASANKKYAGAVKAATGMEPEKAIANYLACVNEYDADLTPAKAATEVGMGENEFKAMIASQKNPGANLSGLAAGESIPRESWEGEFKKVLGYRGK